MKKYWKFVKIVSGIGAIISLGFCIVIPPVGVVLLIINLIVKSKANKELEKLNVEVK